MRIFINCDDNPVTLNKKNYLLRAAQALGITNVVDIKRRDGDEPTDYILNIEPYGFLKGNKWTGVWEIDLLCDRREMNESNWVASDVVFLAGMTYPSRLRGHEDKIRYLFQACEPSLHKKIHTENVYDFVQCGSIDYPLHEQRNKAISLLRDRFTYMDYGSGHNPEVYVKNISSARVQFIRSMNSPIADGEIAQRFFECLAIGPVLTNYVKDLEYLGLEEGVDYFSYKNDYEMVTKFDYLIKYPKEASKMAQRGRQKALMSHTYKHRLLSILNIINDFNNHSDKP